MKYVRPILTVAIVLLVWSLLAVKELVSPLFLPDPRQVLLALCQQLTVSPIYNDILATSWRALTGVTISAALGIPVGLLFGRSQSLYDYFSLPIDFLRSIPSSALFFLFIFAFGIDDLTKVAVVVYGCLFIMVVGSAYGARDTREKVARREVLKVVGASRWQQFMWTTLPDAVPHILSSLRICVSLSLVLVVVTEMFLSSSVGLGRRIYDYYLGYQVPEMYAAIFILGFMGFLLNQLLVILERRSSIRAISD